MDKNKHTTVLLSETVDGLQLKKNNTAIDATVGAGGHAELLAQAIGKGTLLAIDADESSLALSKERLKDASAKVIYLQGNFRNIKELAKRAGVTSAEGVIFDLGWRAEQLASGRGFSFKAHEPLLMTVASDISEGMLTAKDIIAGWDEEEIAKMIREYGEEKFSGRIARAIVEARREGPIETAHQLAEIISAVVPAFYRNGRIHPATRTFQALRIAVNDELEALKEALKDAIDILTPGGRVAVISFHSLEDRIVKNTFREAEDEEKGTRITKKPIIPSRAEQLANPRSRSAKLRIFEKNEEK
jgi:16S rRNA (cytosine1402-N4)-methyltransferase